MPRGSPPPPLDAPALDRLALRYVERFATTRGRLVDYLRRKLRERGWEGTPPDLAALAERFAELGYVDDRAYAEAKAGALTRRGFGARRVADALRQARVGEEDAAGATTAIGAQALAAALVFARRRRIGPYAQDRADRPLREKQLAAMARAGHALSLARRIVEASPGVLIEVEDSAVTHCDGDEPC